MQPTRFLSVKKNHEGAEGVRRSKWEKLRVRSILKASFQAHREAERKISS